MRATIITDASWCPNTGVAGWAAWVAGDHWKSQGFSGPTFQVCKSSNEAEAIAASIGCGIAFRVFKAHTLLIQSDSLYVGRNVWKYLPPDVQEHCQVRYKHVKGHTKIKDARSWVNRWADKEAKAHMRKLRDSI